jgi:penicillin-binding protein 1C
MSGDIAIAPARTHARRRRWIRLTAAAAVVASLITIAVFGAWVVSLGPTPLAAAHRVTTTVVDRNGKLLRAYAMADGRWRLPVDARADVDPTYLKLLPAYEDKRFYSPDGVDLLA